MGHAFAVFLSPSTNLASSSSNGKKPPSNRRLLALLETAVTLVRPSGRIKG
jgi:hypothetical protein